MRQHLTQVILPQLLSGARNGLALAPIAAQEPLQALSLAGQALRFEPPVQPGRFQVEDRIDDPRAIIPEAARRPLMRLLATRSLALQPAEVRIVQVLAERRLRLHPFDMPKLEKFVQVHAEMLGGQALAFCERDVAPHKKQTYFAPDALTDETWMRATPAIRRRYVDARRAADPAVGRALVEAVWGGENADGRLRLLSCLRAGLSVEDRPFLTGLAGDKSQQVRDLAQKYLSRLPGFDGPNPALSALLDRIRRGTTGLIFRKPTLALERSATVQETDAPGWVWLSVGDVGLDELAQALSLTPVTMAEAAHGDPLMAFGCLVMASAEKRFDLLEMIIAGQGNTMWDMFNSTQFERLIAYSPAERHRWADTLVRPELWGADDSLWPLVRLVKLLDGPASDRLFQSILRSVPFQLTRSNPDRMQDQHAMSLALLCPSDRRDLLRRHVSEFEPARTANALLLLDIMDILETAAHV
nr:DUF5691 domain-containing protein [uncultured Gellertiella sp.]